jgi:aldose 1-epimerase
MKSLSPFSAALVGKLVLGGLLCITALGFVGCVTQSVHSSSSITKAAFGTTTNGQPVEIFTLRNSSGAEACIMTYGGIVQSLSLPDKHGGLVDVVLGYDHLQGYLDKNPYFGAIVGRYANRIRGGKFAIDGQTYTLATNNGPNCLHGGRVGFDKVVWQVVSAQVRSSGPELELSYLSKDGEEGFPGNLRVKARYVLTEKNELQINYTATTDKPTVINLSHHSYFNLAGQGNGDVLNHVLYINADRFTPVDSTQIPTGEFADVTGTPFDFRTPTAIGARIDDPHPVLQFGRGYDQNWVINKLLGKLGLLARVVEPASGRALEVWSDEPGLQFYTGNYLNGTIRGKGGVIYQKRSGFCLEPQHYPDSPNQPGFSPVVLRPGQVFRSTIIYKFFLP